ncbi:hypothetical protein GH714_036387 [Hevea brasiliensis]|uniref:Uncharacterized protein n=1 Tax=Hevea brasiliensis TaxID=3981 RepID=A0A6A6KME2_HEVBR|nr:hypothetical protein GH714_036387 [Hevea brasiliensis]
MKAAKGYIAVVQEPVVPEEFSSASHLYYDSTWNSLITTSNQENPESQLSRYLHWLEDLKVQDKSSNGDPEGDVNEIDRLADMFIASCHEKFMLEKQESYRRSGDDD